MGTFSRQFIVYSSIDNAVPIELLEKRKSLTAIDGSDKKAQRPLLFRAAGTAHKKTIKGVAMRRRMFLQKAVTIAAVPLLGVLLLTVTPGMASARPGAKSHGLGRAVQAKSKSPAGTYAYYDSYGD